VFDITKTVGIMKHIKQTTNTTQRGYSMSIADNVRSHIQKAIDTGHGPLSLQDAGVVDSPNFEGTSLKQDTPDSEEVREAMFSDGSTLRLLIEEHIPRGMKGGLYLHLSELAQRS
jgi:hypothetical protein